MISLTMNRNEWKTYKELAIHILMDAIRDIENGFIDIGRDIRPDKDIRWIHSEHSNFKFWCKVAELDPELVRNKYPVTRLSNLIISNSSKNKKKDK